MIKLSCTYRCTDLGKVVVVMMVVVLVVETSSESMNLWMVVESFATHKDIAVLSVLSSHWSAADATICIFSENLVVGRHLIDLELIC